MNRISKVFALGALVGMALCQTGKSAAQGTPKTIEVTAKRFTFEPGEITLKKGEPVLLIVHSVDVAHGLRFRELNVDLSVHAKGTSQARFTPEKAGDFVGHCSVFCGAGHGSMTLKLHVVE